MRGNGTRLAGAWALAAALTFGAGCGDDEGVSTCPSAACPCTANDCACEAGASCVWTSAGDDAFTCGEDARCDVGCGGADCEVDCVGSWRCDVQAGNSVDVDCVTGASCAVSAGASADLLCDASRCEFQASDESDVTCRGGATCEVTCAARCTVACEGDGTSCTLRCAGDDAPSPVDGEASCG